MPDLKAPQIETLQSSSMGEALLLHQDTPRWTELLSLHHAYSSEMSGLLVSTGPRHAWDVLETMSNALTYALLCVHAGSAAADIHGFGRVLWQIITGDTDAWTEAKMRLPRCKGAIAMRCHLTNPF